MQSQRVDDTLKMVSLEISKYKEVLAAAQQAREDREALFKGLLTRIKEAACPLRIRYTTGGKEISVEIASDCDVRAMNPGIATTTLKDIPHDMHDKGTILYAALEALLAGEAKVTVGGI